MDYRAIKQAIKEQINIVDIISPYVDLTSAGNSLKGKSPFTNEKTPSFFVSPDKGVFYCFSSQKGGDIFTFIQEIEGVDYKESFQLLAEKAGIDVSKYKDNYRKDTSDELYSVLKKAKDTYHQFLSGDIRNYLHKRGLNDETIQAWEIGFAPAGWKALTDTMIQKKVLEQAGLCITGNRGMYDRFRNRIMFPFHNVDSRIVGFSGRKVEGSSEEEPKYINTPETAVFHKSRYVYGLYFAKQHIRKNGFSILMEGPMDVLLAHQTGFPVAVAASGTAVSEYHLRLLQQLSNNLLLAFDQDSAGIRASIRAGKIALQLGMNIKLVLLPKGKDPADIIMKDSKMWRESVKQAIHIIDFLLLQVEEKYPKKNQDRIHAVKESVLPVIATMNDALDRDVAINSIISFCDVSLESVKTSLSKLRNQYVQNIPIVKKSKMKSMYHNKNRLQRDVCAARDFLKKENVPIPEDIKKQMQEIESYLSLETDDAEGAVSELRFNNEYKQEERNTKVLDILQTITKKLLIVLLREHLTTLIREEKNSEKPPLTKNRETYTTIQQRLRKLSM